MTGPQQQAYTTEAGGSKSTAFNPTGSDKCFLCGNHIGETDPRQFWSPQGSNSMMLGHTSCIRKFEANNYQWPDGENILLSQSQSEAMLAKAGLPEPTNPQDFVMPPASEIKASNIRFDTFQDMQSFIAARGHIPESANVFVGEQQVQIAQ